MAKGAARSYGWALGLVAVWAILREAKSFEFPSWPEFPTIQFKGTNEALVEQSEALQTYEAERVVAATNIEAQRASTQLAAGNYGTVDGPQGAFTGTWYNTPTATDDSCHVLGATSASSNATRYFTGKYCRNARAAGLIE